MKQRTIHWSTKAQLTEIIAALEADGYHNVGSHRYHILYKEVLPNTIYGFCFMWLLSLFPKLGKEMGKPFGSNFIFCLAFQPVLPAIAGFFVLFCFFKKLVWGNFCQ